MWRCSGPMSAVIGANNPEVQRCVTELVGRLAGRVSDIVSAIVVAVRSEIPELVPDEAQIVLLNDAIRGNIETILYALRHTVSLGDTQAPIAAVEHTRRLAQHGIPLTACRSAASRRSSDLSFNGPTRRE